jgi:hypothetical protein
MGIGILILLKFLQISAKYLWQFAAECPTSATASSIGPIAGRNAAATPDLIWIVKEEKRRRIEKGKTKKGNNNSMISIKFSELFLSNSICST